MLALGVSLFLRDVEVRDEDFFTALEVSKRNDLCDKGSVDTRQSAGGISKNDAWKDLSLLGAAPVVHSLQNVRSEDLGGKDSLLTATSGSRARYATSS